jgi:hypothetical protein
LKFCGGHSGKLRVTAHTNEPIFQNRSASN